MIKRKLERYLQILSNIDSDQDKFIWIMDYGKNSSNNAMKQHKAKSFEVPGCQSQYMVSPTFCRRR
jgi:sulfur transfer protein SufE